MTAQATPSTQPTKPPKRLTTLGQVRREMTAVYLDMRGGVIASQDGSRLVYALDQIAGVIAAEQIEQRIDCIEKRVQP